MNKRETQEYFAGFVLDFLSSQNKILNRNNLQKFFEQEGLTEFEVKKVNYWSKGTINIDFLYEGTPYGVEWTIKH